MANNLIYDISDKPRIKDLLLYSFQMLLAILTATVAVPTIIGLPTQIPSAILGAGVGTLIYVLFTKGKSPVMLSSSFAFLSAFPTAIAFGYMGIVLGGIFAGLIYIIIAIVIKFAGVAWLDKLLPPVIIGPVVALIGLSLSSSAVADLTKANGSTSSFSYNLIGLLCGLVTFFVIVIISNQTKKPRLKIVPFIIGILAGYAVASIFTAIGIATNTDYLKIINWDDLVNNFKNISITSFFDYPRISIVEAIKELSQGHVSEAIAKVNPNATLMTPIGVAQVALAFCPIAFVTLAEHIADHKNISRIIDKDLLKDPGLHRTLLGDGFGTIGGTVCGICPNTTYGESVACVAMTRNASIITTITTSIMCLILAFLTPFNQLLGTVPRCVMGGVCLTLYGFIAVSGLRMFKDIDLDSNVNLMTVSSILIAGIGGLVIKIPYQFKDGQVAATIEITSIATALILGICTYQVAKKLADKKITNTKDVVEDIKVSDYFRAYLKAFSNDELAEALFIFNFKYESVDFAASSLSNLMRSKTQLSLLSKEDLIKLINIFNFEGIKKVEENNLKNNNKDKNNKTYSKDKLIKIIKNNILRIDSEMVKPIVAQEIR